MKRIILVCLIFAGSVLYAVDFGSETVIYRDGDSIWYLLSSRSCPTIDEFSRFAYEYAFDFDNEWKEADQNMYDYLFKNQRVFRPNTAYIVRHINELYGLDVFPGKKLRLISLRMVYFSQNYEKAWYFYSKSTVWEILDDR